MVSLLFYCSHQLIYNWSLIGSNSFYRRRPLKPTVCFMTNSWISSDIHHVHLVLTCDWSVSEYGITDWLIVSITKLWAVPCMAANKSVIKQPVHTVPKILKAAALFIHKWQHRLQKQDLPSLTVSRFNIYTSWWGVMFHSCGPKHLFLLAVSESSDCDFNYPWVSALTDSFTLAKRGFSRGGEWEDIAYESVLGKI